MQYRTVYSPEGEMFEVTDRVANKLVLDMNWTQTPVVFIESTETKIVEKIPVFDFVAD